MIMTTTTRNGMTTAAVATTVHYTDNIQQQTIFGIVATKIDKFRDNRSFSFAVSFLPFRYIYIFLFFMGYFSSHFGKYPTIDIFVQFCCLNLLAFFLFFLFLCIQRRRSTTGDLSKYTSLCRTSMRTMRPSFFRLRFIFCLRQF